jgi:hypothetical protein
MGSMSETFTVKGVWRAVAYDGDKEYDRWGRLRNPILWEHQQTNLIVTVGKQLNHDHLLTTGTATLTGTAVGTSSTAAAVGDTTITGAVFKAFATTPTRSGLVNTYLSSYTTAEANITINEAGLLTASGGILFNRVAPFLGFAKTSAVALDVTTTVTIS